MRFTEYLAESDSQYGIVITNNETGKFEDVALYDMVANKPTYGDAHSKNVFDAIVDRVRDNDAWHELETIVRQHAKGRTLGDSYDDTPGHTNVLYGPLNLDALSSEIDQAYPTAEEQNENPNNNY